MTVRFGDTDPAGLVYYPNVFHYLHEAMEEFFAARCGITYHQLVARERIGFPTVNVQAEFLHPLVYGDVVEVMIKVDKIGQTSLTLDYALKKVGDQAVCATSRQVHVSMDLDTRRPVSIPQFLLDGISDERPSNE
jgi:YbgC/YbaW family acyl-CoA thioester hydrolase